MVSSGQEHQLMGVGVPEGTQSVEQQTTSSHGTDIFRSQTNLPGGVNKAPYRTKNGRREGIHNDQMRPVRRESSEGRPTIQRLDVLSRRNKRTYSQHRQKVDPYKRHRDHALFYAQAEGEYSPTNPTFIASSHQHAFKRVSTGRTSHGDCYEHASNWSGSIYRG